jgi:hypothetical protein
VARSLVTFAAASAQIFSRCRLATKINDPYALFGAWSFSASWHRDRFRITAAISWASKCKFILTVAAARNSAFGFTPILQATQLYVKIIF